MMADYRIGFRSMETEYADIDLEVHGAVPTWLDGVLLRNGPGHFEVGGEPVSHWFDGLAMVRRFAFQDGAVTFSNRFLRTETYHAHTADDTLASPQFATGTTGTFSALREVLVPRPTDNTNVNVLRSGETYLGLTETPRYVAFDPETLETEGEWTFDDGISGHLACAHPVTDPRTGDTYSLLSRFGLSHEYLLTRLPADGTNRELVASIETSRVGYMHSFALTEQYLVLIEPPLYVDLARLLNPFGGSTFLDSLRWKPGRGSRFVVVDRADGAVVSEIGGPPFFYFHQANASESSDAIVLDLVTFADASVLDALSLADLSAGEFTHPMGDLERFRLSVEDGSVDRETLYAGHLSLPRVNESRLTRPYRFVYAQGATGEDRVDFPTGLRKIDVRTGESKWWSDPGLYCAEPVFVPHPDREPEDAGMVLSVVLDTATERSGLLVLDGETFEREAIAWVPDVLPFDFHGQYYPGPTVATQ